jgi:hypothetical protein
MDEYTHKTTYDHPHSKKQRAEKKITTQNSVELLRAQHRAEASKVGRRHHAESEELRTKHDNEIAHDANHHGGRGRGDRERERERRALTDRHQSERNSLAVKQDKEMMAAKAKAAQDLD